MLIKIICIGLCTVIVDIIVKQYKPEIAMLVNVTGGLIIFSIILNQANGLIGEFVNLQNFGNISFDIVKPIIKVIGIGYITISKPTKSEKKKLYTQVIKRQKNCYY